MTQPSLMLESTTQDKYYKQLVDTVHRASPAVKEFFSRARKTANGTYIRVPIVTGYNNTVTASKGYQPIAINPQNNIAYARHDWSTISATITLALDELGSNNSEAGQISLLEDQVEIAQRSLSNALAQMLYEDGNQQFGGPNNEDWIGLKAAVNSLAGLPAYNYLPVTTYGGVTRTPTFWNSTIANLAGVLGTGTLVAIDLDRVKVAIKQACGEVPTHIFMGDAAFLAYNRLSISVTINNQYDPGKVLNGGYGFDYDKMYHGKTVVYHDPFCRTDAAYIMNMKYAHVAFGDIETFKPIKYSTIDVSENGFDGDPSQGAPFMISQGPQSGFDYVFGHLAMTRTISVKGNFVVTSPVHQGLLLNIFN